MNDFDDEKYYLINEQQKQAFDTVSNDVDMGFVGVYLIDALDGTGKTFLLSLIFAKIRSREQIAIAIASSGVAATLLVDVRTAHSAPKLPLSVLGNESYTCNIMSTSSMAKVLREAKIVVWDECTMANKKSLEAFDRTMRDLKIIDALFGDVLLLLAGDFRQTLPVIPRSTIADQLNACLKSSYFWRNV